jgi:CheY-like chemotaxis protein
MAENGKEAVELYKQWKPDIILMDVVMPVMNGIEATRQILEIAGEHDVKIFVVSASALESEQKEIMEIGATVFIKKPVIFDLLLAEMHNKAGVKFIYKEKKKKELTKDSIPSDVPKHLKVKFLAAAAEGDFTLLQDLLAMLEKETGKTFNFIEDSINEMEFEAIINWFES